MSERVFELEEESKLILKIKGSEYRIETPASVQMARYLKAADDYNEGNIKISDFFLEITKHLEELGIPKKTVKELSANQQAKVLEFIYQGASQKN